MQCDMQALTPLGAWPEAFEMPGNAVGCLQNTLKRLAAGAL